MSLENGVNVDYYRKCKQMDKKIKSYAAISNKHIRSFKTLTHANLYESLKYKLFLNKSAFCGILENKK